MSDWNGPWLLLVKVTRQAVTGILAARNCWALEPSIGFNFWVQPLLRSPGVTFWFSSGPNPALSRASPSALVGLPGHQLGILEDCACLDEPLCQLCSSALHPRSRGFKMCIENICLLRGEGGRAGAWGGVYCWPNLEGTSSERGCIVLEKKFMLCLQLLRQ